MLFAARDIGGGPSVRQCPHRDVVFLVFKLDMGQLNIATIDGGNHLIDLLLCELLVKQKILFTSGPLLLLRLLIFCEGDLVRDLFQNVKDFDFILKQLRVRIVNFLRRLQ